MDTAGSARHLLLLLFSMDNLTTLNRDTTLSTRKKEEIGGFFSKADVFLSFPSSPRGKEHTTKPNNTFLPRKELDSSLSLRPCKFSSVSLVACWVSAGTCCPPCLLPNCLHLWLRRLSASPCPETLQIAFFGL